MFILLYFSPVAPSLESKAKKRPPLIHSPEEIIPLVYGREMITYGKKKCVKQVMSETQPTKVDQLPDAEVTKNSDGKCISAADG